MASLLFGLVVLALALWALNAFTKVNPHTAAAVLKAGGGLGALALAGVLGVRGRLDVAIPLGLTGLGLLGWLPWSIPGFAARSAHDIRSVASGFPSWSAWSFAVSASTPGSAGRPATSGRCHSSWRGG